MKNIRTILVLNLMDQKRKTKQKEMNKRTATTLQGSHYSAARNKLDSGEASPLIPWCGLCRLIPICLCSACLLVSVCCACMHVCVLHMFELSALCLWLSIMAVPMLTDLHRVPMFIVCINHQAT